jgi:predicted N-acyltransferase
VTLSLRAYSSVDELPRGAWDQLVRDCHASIFFDTHILDGMHHHSIETPLAARYFAIADRDELVAVAAAHAIRYSVWWQFYEQNACDDVFRAPWITMPTTITWNGNVPLRAGSDPGEIAAMLVAAGRQFARDQGAVALGITNVTRDAPLTAPLRALADLPVFFDNNAVLAMHASFDAYLASLDGYTRRELQRLRRRAAERGCRWVTYRPADYPPGIFDKLLVLANAAAIRYDQDPEYDMAMLTALAAPPSARLLIAIAEGEPVGFFLIHEDADTLYVQAGGWDVSRKELSAFVTLFHDVVQEAHELHKKTIEFGRTNYKFKRKHGCHFVPLYGLFYLTELADEGLRDRLLSVQRARSDYVRDGGGDPTLLT